MSTQDSIGITLAANGVECSQAVMDEIIRRTITEVESVTAFPETLHVLEKLKNDGFKLCSCSNLSEAYAYPVIKNIGHLLDCNSFSFENGFCKPDERMYLDAIQKLGCSIEDCIMIGDTLTDDVVGPAKIGLQSVFLDRFGRTKPENAKTFTNLSLFSEELLTMSRHHVHRQTNYPATN